MNRWHRSALGVCLLFASVTPTLAANLVTNPGFESCTLRRLRIFGQRDKLKADRSKGA
jgi:hypothetical protein